jgi:hypothetical protein
VREPFAPEQRAHVGERPAQVGDRALPLDAVEALGERWAAGADAEREAPVRQPLEPGRGQRDRRRAPAPDRYDRRAEADPRRPRRELGQEDRRVVRPALGDVHALEAQVVSLDREPRDHVRARLERGECDTYGIHLVTTLNVAVRDLPSAGVTVSR